MSNQRRGGQELIIIFQLLVALALFVVWASRADASVDPPQGGSLALRAPDGFVGYGGADISAVHDRSGAVYWAAMGRYGDDGDTWGLHVFRQDAESVREIPLPRIDARGQLMFDPTGLYVAAWHEGQPVLYQIEDFAPFEYYWNWLPDIRR